jgi:branched-chain amino acid transport system permease protein
VSNIELALRGPVRDGAVKVATPLSELPRLLAALVGLGALIALYRSDPFVLNILAYALLFGGVATAWNIIGGFGGQFSLAHGVFFAVGAYVTANLFLYAGVLPWLSLVPAAALAALIAVAISWPTFRLRGPFFAIATMAFNEVAYVLANHFESLTGGARGLAIPFRASLANMIFRDRMSYALLMLGFVTVCLVISIAVYRSRLGYSLQAIRENEEAARACGIDVTRTKLAGMAVSAALTGIGGAMFMMYVRIADPPTLLTLSEVGVKFALIALIGGVGTIYGPILGALLIVPLESWLRATISAEIPGAHLIVLGAVLIVAALFLKRGLVGAGEDLFAWSRRGRGRS